MSSSLDTIFSSLSFEQKASMLAGVDFWHLRGFAEHGVPAMFVADCGHGVTLCGERTSPATCFPTGIGMASTWSVSLMERVGGALGAECLALGVSILLGPKLNLHRIPLNGRSFETFSEDPLLAGLLGAGIIRGIQSQGVGSCVKAMAANNQQKDQQNINVSVSRRALRELYMRQFEIAVRYGKPCAMMTSYNKLDGVNAGENEWMLREVIKREWGFDGLIVSDWNAISSRAVFHSALDLEMPGPGRLLNTAAVLAAVESGEMSREDVEDSARRILQVALQYGRHEGEHTQFAALLDSPESQATAQAVAEEGIVLLKNEGSLLPFAADKIQKLAIIGPNSANARLGGGGSASVTPFRAISPLEGLREFLAERKNPVEILHEEGCSLVGTMQAATGVFTAPDGSPGLLAEFFNNATIGDKADAAWTVPQVDFSWGWAAPGLGVTRYAFATRFSGSLTPRYSGLHQFGIYAQEGCVRVTLGGTVVVDEWSDDGNFEGQYATRYRTFEMDLQVGVPVPVVIEYRKCAARAAVRFEWREPGGEDSIAHAAEVAASADAVVLCLGLSNLFEGGSVDRTTLELPESQVELMRRVVAANPRTVVVLNNGGPVTMPWEPEVPAIIESWYPGQAGGAALARILFGEVNPSGKLPDTLAYHLADHAAAHHYPGNGSEVCYEEELLIGYRHFDKAVIQPHYPFGFGLSYTTFDISAPKNVAFDSDGSLRFSVNVENTGLRAGKEVVQAYFGSPEADATTPRRILVAFEKIALEAGEEKEIAFTVPPEFLAEWNESLGHRDWNASASKQATYTLATGNSSRHWKEISIVAVL